MFCIGIYVRFMGANQNAVLRVTPAAPADALAHFTALMAYSTDVSDVHAAGPRSLSGVVIGRCLADGHSKSAVSFPVSPDSVSAVKVYESPSAPRGPSWWLNWPARVYSPFAGMTAPSLRVQRNTR